MKLNMSLNMFCVIRTFVVLILEHIYYKSINIKILYYFIYIYFLLYRCTSFYSGNMEIHTI